MPEKAVFRLPSTILTAWNSGLAVHQRGLGERVVPGQGRHRREAALRAARGPRCAVAVDRRPRLRAEVCEVAGSTGAGRAGCGRRWGCLDRRGRRSRCRTEGDRDGCWGRAGSRFVAAAAGRQAGSKGRDSQTRQRALAWAECVHSPQHGATGARCEFSCGLTRLFVTLRDSDSDSARRLPVRSGTGRSADGFSIGDHRRHEPT